MHNGNMSTEGIDAGGFEVAVVQRAAKASPRASLSMELQEMSAMSVRVRRVIN